MAGPQGYSERRHPNPGQALCQSAGTSAGNFYTLSETEQGNAIADFAAYLKVAPDQLQINVLTQKFNLNGYLKLMKNRLDCERTKAAVK